MNTRAEFDIGPLTWVKGEIDQSLEKAREALQAYAANPADASKLKHCQTHLHQAHGALQIVGLDGVTRFSEELELFLASLEKQDKNAIAPLAALGERAFSALSTYLERLLNGEPNLPLRLFPLYRELLLARGVKEAEESDLYFPDLSHRPPKRDSAPVSLGPAELAAYFRDQRGKFQRGLLKWIRQDDAGAREMREAVAGIETTQILPAQRAFWWVALGLFDALIFKALPRDANPKPLLSRVEQQIKRMLDGSPNVAERLLREALYFVARAAPASQQVQQVQEVYELAGTVPGNEPAKPEDATTRQPLIRVLREAVSGAKDAWNKFTSGNQSGLVGFREQAAAMNDHAALLDSADLAGLMREIAALSVWLSGNPQKMNEAIAMEVATALLLADNTLENFKNLSPEFAQQAQVMGARLKACVLGKPHTGSPGVPLLDEMSRRAQERLVLGQVVAEMQANLRQVEQGLDSFFRDASTRSELAGLDKPIKQVLGALAMLGEEKAGAALRASQAFIERLAQADFTPAQADFETLAQTLSGLGFYIDALQHGNADFEDAMQPIGTKQAQAAEAEEAASGDTTVPSTVEAQLEQQKRDAQTLLEAFKEKPADKAIKEELKQSLAAIQQDANLVADAATGDRAEKALSMLAETSMLSLESLSETIGQMAPASADAPSPEAEKMLDASAEAVDAELLQIYLEEAGEVLATIATELQQLRNAPQDQGALTTIRRGFHTLKGSGRMVGLNRLGEAAWSVERSMNLWLEENRAATPDLFALIEAAHVYFGEGVAKLMQGSPAGDEQPLLAMADKVRAGKPLGTAPAGPAAPVTVSQAIATVEPAAAATPPVVEAPPPAAPAADQTIIIGPLKLTSALYDIFMGEAGSHLAAMRSEFEKLTQHGVVTDEFMRAAHTLGGIAGTVKLADLRELGYGLERALEQLAFRSVSPDEQTIIDNAIAALEGMLAAVRDKRLPDAAPALVAQLEQLAKPQVEDAMADWVPEVAAPPEPPATAQPIVVPGVVLEQVTSLPMQRAAKAAAADDALLPEQPSADDMVVEEIEVERRTQRMLDEIDPTLLPIFLEEANELVPQIGADLRSWRASPKETGAAQSLLRLLHTLKGSSRMAGAMALGELTHHMESRVETAVQLNIVPTALFDELDTSYDRVNYLMDRLRSPQAESLEATTVFGIEPPAAFAPAAPIAPAAKTDAEPLPQTLPAAAKPSATEPAAAQAMLRVRATVLDRLVNQAGEVAIGRSRIEGEMRTLKGLITELTENVLRLRSQLREIEIQAETQMQSQQALAQETRKGFDPLEFDRFTRFQELTRLMAESVSDVSTVHQNLLKTLDDTDAALLSQARINRDLQQDLMRVRMVPFQSIAERLYRVVRLSAKEVEKRANLDVRGGQVEMDRSVLERITAPFEHLLRNAITHGLETPAERVAAGKPEMGEIRLDLRQEGNDVVLTLADDGAGLDLPRIRAKAISQGLMREGDQLSEAEIADFIFQPGFSTATVVSQLAGRGVGMDVVKTEIAGLGGRVELNFEAGKGTRFTLYLPLTLAVTQSVLVRAGSRNYAFPAVMVEQVRQMKVEELKACYETRQAEWQGRRYAFYNLQQLLGEAPHVAEAKRFSPVLFLRSGVSVVAMHVDEMVGNQEIVVKNIGPQLARVQGIAGATVLGSGEIVLILNPVQLATRGAAYKPVLKRTEPEEEKAAAAPTIMVVDDSLTVRKITGRLLAREGFQVVTAKDGVDALEQLQETLPDVMLVDIEMPRMDGFDLTRNVRADARLKHIPIIMISSRTAEKHQNYAKEIGVNVFLGKPFQEDELLGHIAGFVKAKVAA